MGRPGREPHRPIHHYERFPKAAGHVDEAGGRDQVAVTIPVGPDAQRSAPDCRLKVDPVGRLLERNDDIRVLVGNCREPVPVEFGVGQERCAS